MLDAAERDRRLAAEAGEGDDQAFAELVGRHRGALVRFVARRTGRGALAEDAVQEALVSAHRALTAGKRPTDVRAWLHTIAWRRALDLARTERDTASLDATELPVAAPGGPEQTVLAAAELERVLHHWQELPDRQRHALALSVLEGRSLHDIGAELDIGEQAAKSLVARSRRTLRERTRAALLLPVAALERLRDLAVAVSAAEPHAALAAKACAVACVSAAGSGMVLTGGTAYAPALNPNVRVVTRAEMKLVTSHVVIRDGLGQPVAEHRCRWRDPQRDDRPCLAFSGDLVRGIKAIHAAHGATATAHVVSEGYDAVRRLSRRADGRWQMRIRSVVDGERRTSRILCDRDATNCRLR